MRYAFRFVRSPIPGWALVGLVLLLAVAACAASRAAPSPTSSPTTEPMESPSPGRPTRPHPLFPQPPTPVPPEPAGAWQRTNIGGGGAFHAVAIGPTGLFLVGSDLSGLYLSSDRGRSWHPVGATQGLTVTHVAGVGVNPQDPDLLYAGTETGLFRSADRGATWQMVLSHGYITDVRFAPSNPAIGYAAYHSRFDAADGTVYSTADRGLTWAPLPNTGLPAGLHILKLVIAPHDPARVYALTGEGRFACGPAMVYTSADGGQSWQALAPGLGNIADFALDPADPTRAFLTTYGDVWDPGYTCIADDPTGGYVYAGPADGRGPWQNLSANLGSRNLLLWATPTALRVLDMDDRSLWETQDQGVTWTLLSDPASRATGWTWGYDAYGLSFGGDAKTLASDPTDPQTLLWIDGQFVWATFDGGRTFGPLHTQAVVRGWRSRGVDNIVPLALAFDADGRHVYAGLADVGCVRSADAGQSWQLCNDPATTGSWEGRGGNVLTVLADPQQPGRVWLSQTPNLDAGPHTLLRSDDFAASWQVVGAGLPDAPIAGLSWAPGGPRRAGVLFVTVGGDVYQSSDAGATWDLAFACGGCRVTAVDPAARVVYAGGEAGLWRWDLDGLTATWTEITPPGFVGDAAGGAFWDTAWRGVAAVRPDPRTPGRVYVAVFGPGQGVFRSDDLGVTWQQVLAHDWAWDVLPLPAPPGWLLVATSSARYSGGYDPGSEGVLLSTEAGATWQAWNQGLAWPFATLLAHDPQHRRVWVAVPGLGFAFRAWPP